jgi:hypothetical protein
LTHLLSLKRIRRNFLYIKKLRKLSLNHLYKKLRKERRKQNKTTRLQIKERILESVFVFCRKFFSIRSSRRPLLERMAKSSSAGMYVDTWQPLWFEAPSLNTAHFTYWTYAVIFVRTYICTYGSISWLIIHMYIHYAITWWLKTFRGKPPGEGRRIKWIIMKNRRSTICKIVISTLSTPRVSDEGHHFLRTT